jgi:non-homologous end joining protein Ku
MKIIRAKMKGQKIEAPQPEEPESTKVLDLMSRLQASLEQSGSRRRKASWGSRTPRRRTA